MTHSPYGRARLRQTVLAGLLAALMAWGVLAQAASADSPPVPESVYWQRLEAIRDEIKEMQELSAAEVAPWMTARQQELQTIRQVQLEDGTVVDVDHSVLIAALRSEPPNPASVRYLLAVLLKAHESERASSHGTADLASLQAILARAEFQPPAAPPSPDWLENFLAWLQRLLERLFPSSAQTTGNELFSWLLLGVGGLALAALLYYVARTLTVSLAGDAHLRAEDGDGRTPLTADAAFTRAQEMADARDYRTAVRYLYLSALLTLDERGLLRYDRTKTNREYVRSLRNEPTLAAKLREVIDLFDRVWYGLQPLDLAAYTRYQEQVAELRRL